MRNDLYRHSVWIDVFGVVLFGAVLLGGTSYLLFHAESATSGLRATAYQPGPKALNGRNARWPTARRVPAGDGELSLPGSEPIADGRRAPRGEVGVPFSDGWRGQAAPELSGASGSSGGQAQGGASGSAGPSGPPGPVSASLPSWREGTTGGGGQASSAAGSGPPSRWRAEARRFSGRARALSNQLGQIARSSSKQKTEEKASPKESSGRASATGASSDDRTVGNPPSVPIDDHVHWLAVLGVLWGTWRIWRGG